MGRAIVDVEDGRGSCELSGSDCLIDLKNV